MTQTPQTIGVKEILKIRTIGQSELHLIRDFRIKQYLSSGEFKMRNIDHLGFVRGSVYVIEIEGNIISTLQCEIIQNHENLFQITNTIIPDGFNQYSTAYLSKGATENTYRNHGFNTLLRYLILINIFQNNHVNSLSSIVYENAPRLTTLKTIGYNFHETKLLSSKYTAPNGGVFFIHLDRNDFEGALEKLRRELYPLFQKYSIQIEL